MSTDRSDPEPGGFWYFVKNPSYRKFVEWLGRRSGSPRELNEAEMRRHVQRLFRKEPEYDTTQLLKAQGRRLLPVLLEALGNPALSPTRYTNHAVSKSPLQEVLSLLEPLAPSEAVPRLGQLAQDQKAEVRKEVALALGNIAQENCIEPLSRLLTDPDEYVRSYGLMGIRRALAAGHGSSEFHKRMFDRIVPLLDDPEFSPAEESPLCLLEMDRERAIPLLLQSAYCNANHQNLWRFLEALTEKKVSVPLERLLELESQLAPSVAGYAKGNAYEQVLICLAHAGGAEGEAIIHRALTNSEKDIRKTAAKAMSILKGVGNATGFVLGRVEEVGFDKLTQPQQVYYSAWVLDAEVRNGGFAQYFVNSSGDHAHVAAKSLAALGAKQMEQLLRQAMSLFGSKGPSPDHSKRHRELASLSDAEHKAMDRLDQEYYDSPESLDILLQEYTRRNADHFRES